MPRQHRRAARRAAAGIASLALLAGALNIPVPSAFAASQPAAGQPSTGWQSAQQQASALVQQMTLDEKISLVHGDEFGASGFAGHVPGIPRLGIPDLYLADGPNGVGDGATGVTAFPVA